MNNVVFASSLHTGSSSISIKDVSPSLHLPKTSYVTQIYIQQCWISISYSTSPPASLLSLCHRSAMSAPYSKIRLCFTLLQILPCVLLLPLPPTTIDHTVSPHTTSEGYGASTCMRQTVAGMKMYPTGPMHLGCWIAKNNLVFHP